MIFSAKTGGPPFESRVGVNNVCSENDPFNNPHDVIITSRMAVCGSVFKNAQVRVRSQELTHSYSNNNISVCSFAQLKLDSRNPQYGKSYLNNVSNSHLL